MEVDGDGKEGNRANSLRKASPGGSDTEGWTEMDGDGKEENRANSLREASPGGSDTEGWTEVDGDGKEGNRANSLRKASPGGSDTEGWTEVDGSVGRKEPAQIACGKVSPGGSDTEGWTEMGTKETVQIACGKLQREEALRSGVRWEGRKPKRYGVVDGDGKEGNRANSLRKASAGGSDTECWTEMGTKESVQIACGKLRREEARRNGVVVLSGAEAVDSHLAGYKTKKPGKGAMTLQNGTPFKGPRLEATIVSLPCTEEGRLPSKVQSATKVYFESSFAGFLILEILLRLHLLRCKRFFCGPEKFWNYFDMLLSVTGITDVLAQTTREDGSDIFGTSLLRFCRLIRLVRIVKVFRLKFMRDLRLMVKGLVAGIRTLALAFTLLFCVIYVISGQNPRVREINTPPRQGKPMRRKDSACFATMTIGTYPRTRELELDEYFKTLPVTMFTAFRCFTGECVNSQGFSLTALLSQEYGLLFGLAYVASYMLVAMGIFNVILAVYVEITMKAAKENEAVTAEQWARESIRIARVTRELLKRFAAAYRLFTEFDENSSSISRLDISPEGALFTDDDVHEGIAINKDLFLLVIQDRQVQVLMDDLDLPPDRANLFEIIDADGSGTLQITELVQGLLKIRGEINKSDAVAALLVSQSVQSLVVNMREELGRSLAEVKEASNRHLLTLWAQLDRLSHGSSVEFPPLQRPSYGFYDADGPADVTNEARRPELLLQAEERDVSTGHPEQDSPERVKTLTVPSSPFVISAAFRKGFTGKFRNPHWDDLTMAFGVCPSIWETLAAINLPFGDGS
eukprot:s1710_g12.t1